MTKDEILKKHYRSFDIFNDTCFPTSSCIDAMDQYAKQECIEFAKWVDTFGYTKVGDGKWGSYHNMSGISDENLYKKYLQSKTK